MKPTDDNDNDNDNKIKTKNYKKSNGNGDKKNPDDYCNGYLRFFQENSPEFLKAVIDGCFENIFARKNTSLIWINNGEDTLKEYKSKGDINDIKKILIAKKVDPSSSATKYNTFGGVSIEVGNGSVGGIKISKTKDMTNNIILFISKKPEYNIIGGMNTESAFNEIINMMKKGNTETSGGCGCNGNKGGRKKKGGALSNLRGVDDVDEIDGGKKRRKRKVTKKKGGIVGEVVKVNGGKKKVTKKGGIVGNGDVVHSVRGGRKVKKGGEIDLDFGSPTNGGKRRIHKTKGGTLSMGALALLSPELAQTTYTTALSLANAGQKLRESYLGYGTEYLTTFLHMCFNPLGTSKWPILANNINDFIFNGGYDSYYNKFFGGNSIFSGGNDFVNKKNNEASNHPSNVKRHVKNIYNATHSGPYKVKGGKLVKGGGEEVDRIELYDKIFALHILGLGGLNPYFGDPSTFLAMFKYPDFFSVTKKFLPWMMLGGGNDDNDNVKMIYGGKLITLELGKSESSGFKNLNKYHEYTPPGGIPQNTLTQTSQLLGELTNYLVKDAQGNYTNDFSKITAAINKMKTSGQTISTKSLIIQTLLSLNTVVDTQFLYNNFETPEKLVGYIESFSKAKKFDAGLVIAELQKIAGANTISDTFKKAITDAVDIARIGGIITFVLDEDYGIPDDGTLNDYADRFEKYVYSVMIPTTINLGGLYVPRLATASSVVLLDKANANTQLAKSTDYKTYVTMWKNWILEFKQSVRKQQAMTNHNFGLALKRMLKIIDNFKKPTIANTVGATVSDFITAGNLAVVIGYAHTDTITTDLLQREYIDWFEKNPSKIVSLFVDMILTNAAGGAGLTGDQQVIMTNALKPVPGSDFDADYKYKSDLIAPGIIADKKAGDQISSDDRPLFYTITNA